MKVVNLQEHLQRQQELEKQGFLLDNRGNLQKRWENLKVILDNANVKIRKNVLTSKTDFEGLGNASSLESRIAEIQSLALDAGLDLSYKTIKNLIPRIADECEYNPISEFLEEANKRYNYVLILDDDSEKLLATEIYKLFKAIKFNFVSTDINKEYQFYFKCLCKWLIQCLELAENNLNKNLNSNFILILYGKQGCGKTRLIKKMFPDNLLKSESNLDVKNKDSIIKNLGYWCTELAEFNASIKRSNIDEIKGFLTSPNDEIRGVYKEEPEVKPRRTNFIATVNNVDFLVDATGNRRFVTFPILSIEDIDIDIYKFWNEVQAIRNLKLDDFLPWLNQEEIAYNDLLSMTYMNLTEEDILLEHCLDWSEYNCKKAHITLGRLKQFLEVNGSANPSQIVKINTKRLREALEKRGIKECRKTYTDSMGNKKQSNRGFIVPYHEKMIDCLKWTE